LFRFLKIFSQTYCIKGSPRVNIDVGLAVVRVVEVLSVATGLLGTKGRSLIWSKIKGADEGKVVPL